MTAAEPAPVAVVDCGSNATRLLLGRVVDGRVEQPDRRAVITRLGGGVDRSGRIGADAISRVARVLERYAQAWTAAGATRVAVCATSAVRDASNAAEFSDRVAGITGTRPVVLAGDDEAELTFAGAVDGRTDQEVVCDIGGGSTELIAGAGVAQHRVSTQLGSVRLRERHLRHDPPTPEEYAGLVAAVRATLAPLPDVYAHAGAPLVAVAGTATTLAAVATGAGPHAYGQVDGVRLSLAQLRQVVEDLAWIPASERLSHAAIVPGREDVIVAGGLVLLGIAECFGFSEVEVRVADLLDGVAARVAAGRWPPAAAVPS